MEAVPNDGYYFVQWSDGISDNPRTIVVAQDTTFTAEFAKNIFSIEKIADAEQGHIDGPSEAEYLTEVSLEAVPNDGYRFVQWSDGISYNPRTIVVTQDTAFTAEFAKTSIRYNVDLEVNDDLMGYVDGGGQYVENSQVFIYAEPYEGYQFVGWYAGDELLSNKTEMSITVNSDTTLTAVFKSISMSSNLAMIYIYDKPIEGFEPDNHNYTFRYPIGTQESDLPTAADITWDVSDEYQTVQITQVEATIILNVTSGRGLTHVYVLAFVIERPNLFTVTTLSNNEAWGSVIGGNVYMANARVSVGAFAAEGYQFYHWNNSITDNPYTFVLTQDTTFAALFLPNSTEDIITEVTSTSVHMEWEAQSWGILRSYWVYIYIDKDHKQWYCRMRFHWTGLLLEFHWGPASHNYDPDEPNIAEPWQFSHMPARHLAASQAIAYDLTDLDPNQKYYYTLEGLDESDQVITAQAGTFVTPKNVPTDIDDVEEETEPQKIMRDGILYILRDGEMYNAQGARVE